MDFSQPNKINSSVPIMLSNQNNFYSKIPSNSFNSNVLTKNFHQNSSRCVHQSPNFNPQNHQSMTKQLKESSKRNFTTNIMTKNFEPYSFNTTSQDNYCSAPFDSYFNHESSSGQHQQQMQQPFKEDMNDFNIEFFECPPQVMNTCKSGRNGSKSTNPFIPIIESIHKQDKSINKNDSSANSQTYFYSYNLDKDDIKEQETEEIHRNDEQLFKSYTKIISIPNGVKIITEIKKEDNSNIDEQIKSNSIISSTEKWLNKQIEITLDNNINGTGDGDDKGSSSGSEFFEKERVKIEDLS